MMQTKHHNHILLKPLRALIILGPEGVGKTTLARQIAASWGSYMEVDSSILNSPFEFGSALQNAIRTVIVNEFKTTLASVKIINDILSGDTIVLQRKNQDPVLRATPNFIFCSNDINAINIPHDDGRFSNTRVIYMTSH